MTCTPSNSRVCRGGPRAFLVGRLSLTGRRVGETAWAQRLLFAQPKVNPSGLRVKHLSAGAKIGPGRQAELRLNETPGVLAFRGGTSGPKTTVTGSSRCV